MLVLGCKLDNGTLAWLKEQGKRMAGESRLNQEDTGRSPVHQGNPQPPVWVYVSMNTRYDSGNTVRSMVEGTSPRRYLACPVFQSVLKHEYLGRRLVLW